MLRLELRKAKHTDIPCYMRIQRSCSEDDANGHMPQLLVDQPSTSRTRKIGIRTPAMMIGGHRSCIASDHQAHVRAGDQGSWMITKRSTGGRTCNDLDCLDAQRIRVDLSNGVLLVLRRVEALQPGSYARSVLVPKTVGWKHYAPEDHR